MRAHNYQLMFVNYCAIYRIDCIYRNNFHITHAKCIPSIAVRVSMYLYGFLFPKFYDVFLLSFGLNGTADGPSRSNTHIETS
jgi:hypothetical protein